MTMRRAIGLMSGTSLDGIDVALIESDGESVRVLRKGNDQVAALGPTGYREYAQAERALLSRALRDAEAVAARTDRPGCLPEAEAFLTDAHAEAVEAFLSDNTLTPADIAAIGFHGQTVLHRPREKLTVQIGDGAALARRLGIPVVADLRAEDVARGGQGAPLVPVFHRALAQAAGYAGPLAVLNIGGVANVTLIDSKGNLLAFDTGPGNAPINDWMKEREGVAYDAGGARAAGGQIDEALVAWLLTHPYFERTPPKSLDRHWFSHKLAGHLSTADGAATLTAFAARAIRKSLDHVSSDEQPMRWIVAGGGTRNLTLMAMLGDLLGDRLVNADTLGWSADYLEAQAFAYLALRSLEGLPITYPSTTGVSAPAPGGVLHHP
ncbi:anhydro-N-acetylmuramic acid kinase [Methylorubrum suomiense]|nr:MULTISPECIES: anhydro-N-acetylmuramic acid kinase [Methylobacteriaceae]